jgi:putative ATP-dependent endonuclease of OLD family
MHVKRIIIARYRGLKSLSWDPARGVNCLIGPGDTGKSTLLSAVSLLLAPYPVQQASEFDYFERQLAEGFSVEAYLGGMNSATLVSGGTPPSLCGWLNGGPCNLPDEDGAEAVLHCRVRGTSELEIVHEIITDESTVAPFPVKLRQKMLLTRLVGEERSGRDLRLGSGSLLDRFLEPSSIRPAIQKAVALASTTLDMPAAVKKNLAELGTRFGNEGLPSHLHLGLFPQQGSGATGMVALFTGAKSDRSIPLAYSGMGTRQLAVISLSTSELREDPVIVVDEPERGLEPYRQRLVVRRLVQAVGSGGQAFVTTHSPAVLSSLDDCCIWRMKAGPAPPVQFNKKHLCGILKRDPEAFFAPCPVFCEGPTELGLLTALLPKYLASGLTEVGIHLADGRGQPNVFDVIGAFYDAGLPCAAFLDNESEHSGRRAAVSKKCALFVWERVCNIEEALARHLPKERFSELFLVASRQDINRARAKEDQVRQSLGITEPGERTAFPELFASRGDEPVRTALYTVMNDHEWFKSAELGFALGTALLKWGVPAFINTALATFASHLPQLPRHEPN